LEKYANQKMSTLHNVLANCLCMNGIPVHDMVTLPCHCLVVMGLPFYSILLKHKRLQHYRVYNKGMHPSQMKHYGWHLSLVGGWWGSA